MIFGKWRIPPSVLFYAARRASKKHWSQTKKKTASTNRALAHFDEFYGEIFGERWEAMRKAFFRKSKHVAVVNNFGDEAETRGLMARLGAHNIRDVFEKQRAFDLSLGKTPSVRPRADDAVLKFSNDKKASEISDIYGQAAEEAPTSLDVGETVISTGDSEPPEISSRPTSIASKLSLRAGMDEAELDESRIVDGKLGMSAAGLWTYIPATKIKGLEDWLPESHYYSYYNNSKDFPISIEEDDPFEFPEHLNAYSFEPDNFSTFPEPKFGTTGVLNYYIMDGASLLPVLALGLKPKDRVLDLCAAPGGKTLAILQTHLPDIVYCCDSSLSRVKRINKVFREYLYDFDSSNEWKEKIFVQNSDGTTYQDSEGFDKVLVDVPCTTDRLSLKENDNNIFNPMRLRERLKIPELQSSLLCNALTLCRVGGCVVYSTCTLSPIQNDGVVHMSLKKVWEDHNIKATIKLMNVSLDHATSIYRFGRGSALPKYGSLITPHISANFGPMYFAKIVRTQ